VSLEKVFDLLPFPGQLSSQSFDCLLQDKTFARRICALDIDELQLGVIRHSERPFDTSLILSRLPRRTVMRALMAALLGEQETTKLLKTLSLCSGPFFFGMDGLRLRLCY